ncbi:Flagellar biosynthesis protein FliP [Labilithrix luteola]|uniref:Flagellar biosynthetic protein FliP n=1 Tax=Labilithrix luteola TaxID=1391654 RepID=A0A0K1PMG9_9BACT|nr:flagellar type III secretion system pore protein FliP [Labilithrix luteola]AKU94718.1 Flagellar biosynthesis protein FliP [Labilithrix luteola]
MSPPLDITSALGAASSAAAGGGPGLAPQLKILAVLTLLSLLPAIVLTMTSFTRTAVVLSFVRQGLGTQQAPPSQVLVGIALFITAFTMAPVTNTIIRDAYQPYAAGQIDETTAMDRAVVPLRAFMLRQTREADLALFYESARAPMPTTEDDVSLRMAAPAFVVSELTTAFQMGVMVLLPFLVIDLIVASILMSLGMMMMPPQSISLPLKLLLFVAVDGWHLIVGSLLRSFS